MLNESRFDFSELEALSKELNPDKEDIVSLEYDKADYTDLSVVLSHIQTRTRVIDVKALLPQLSSGGRVIDEPMETYLATKACSSGQLKEALISPLHWYICANNPETRPEKKAFELGTFLHTAFLEPEKFEDLILEPQVSLSSKEGVQTMINFYEKVARGMTKKGGASVKFPLKKARHHFKKSGLSLSKIDGMREYLVCLKDAVGKVAVDAKTHMIVQLIKRNYNAYGGGIIPKLMEGVCCETSFHTSDPATGLRVKIRPDAFNLEENVGCNMIISLKTTHAESVEKMQYDAAKYKYQLSEGMYTEVFERVTGRKCTMVICIMIQTVSPYLPAVFVYSPDDLANGKYRYRLALQNVKDAMEKEYYPGFDSFAEPGDRGIIRMKLPEWSLKEALPQTVDLMD